jgi:MarR family transcriptional regulator, organic hydroperoxide resistance regulator
MNKDIEFKKFFVTLEQFHDKMEQKLHTKLKGYFEHLTILQIKACMVISSTENMTMTNFAQALYLKTSGATQLIDKMVDLKLVTRDYDAKDRRLILISLTPTMKLQMKKMKKIENQIFQEAFGKLNLEEMQNLSNMLQKII